MLLFTERRARILVEPTAPGRATRASRRHTPRKAVVLFVEDALFWFGGWEAVLPLEAHALLVF